MIIGIDISSIPYGTGVSNYTLNLVKSLLKIDKTNHYKLFFSSLRQPFPPQLAKLKHPQLKIYHFKLPPTFFQIVWNQLHVLPLELFIGPCDVFHTWDWTQPPAFRAKTVTTIHDFVPLLFPETQHPKTIKNFKRKLALAVAECSHFICVSENTHQDLSRLFPQLKPQRSSVIYEAAEDKYAIFQRQDTAIKTRKTDKIRRQYDLHRFVLAQGTREPRKNLDRLIRAFKLFLKNNPNTRIDLVIAGKYGWGKDIDHLRHPYLKVLGYVPEKDMVALHAAALCLAYPSLYEGFGLPPLKSMSLGVPVLTSNVSSLPEVVSQAAVLVNPTSVDDIARGLEKVLKNNRLRKRLIIQGLTRSLQFSWAKTAHLTLSVYQQLFLDKP